MGEDFDPLGILETKVQALDQRVLELERKVFKPKLVITEEDQRVMMEMVKAYIATAQPTRRWKKSSYVYANGDMFYIQPQPLIEAILRKLGIKPNADLLGAKAKSIRAGDSTRHAWGWPIEQFKDLLKPEPEKQDPKSIEPVPGWVTIPEFCRRGDIPEHAVRTMVEKDELTVGYYIDGEMTTIEFDEGSRKYLKLDEIPKAAALKLERTPGRPAIEAAGPEIPAWHKEGEPDGKAS